MTGWIISTLLLLAAFAWLVWEVKLLREVSASELPSEAYRRIYQPSRRYNALEHKRLIEQHMFFGARAATSMSSASSLSAYSPQMVLEYRPNADWLTSQ